MTQNYVKLVKTGWHWNPQPKTAQEVSAHDGLISRSLGEMAAISGNLKGLHL